MTFFARLEQRARAIDSLLCIGLDPHPGLLPSSDAKAAWRFCMGLIEETSDYAVAFKPNIAFFEAFGPDGLMILGDLIEAVPDDIPVIVDAKRGDIGSTGDAYAAAIFDQLGADAVTVSPYLGEDSVAPFLARKDKGVFVLARTSNPAAATIQDEPTSGGGPLYEHVVHTAGTWAGPDRLGFVVGATAPAAVARVRVLAPQSWILAPGVGAQGAHLDRAVAAGLREDGSGLLIPVARAIATADDPGPRAGELVAAINQACAAATSPPPADDIGELAEALFGSGCVRFGEFRLKSGAQSSVYVDLRRLASHPEALGLVARVMRGKMEDLDFDVVAAIPYGALPIGTAIALQSGWPLIYPRREVKDYGTQSTIEGEFASGQRAVVLDDLATTGESKLQAIGALRDAGLEVSDVVVLIDRQGGAAEALQTAGLDMHAVVTLGELADVLESRGLITSQQRDRVAAYLNG